MATPEQQAQTTSIRVFCSYRSDDRATVEPFAERLRTERGVDAWLDVWDIRPGDDFVRRMDEGVRQCDVALLFLSKNYLQGPWATNEMWDLLFRAVEDQTGIIPVKIGAPNMSPLPIAVRRRSARTIDEFDSIADVIVGLDRRPALADALRATRRDALIRVTGEGAGRYRTELFIDGQARATASDLRIPFRPALHGDVGLGDLDRAAAAVTAVLAGGAVGEQLAALVQGLTVGTRVDVAVELPPDLLDLPVELTAVGGETRRPLALIPGVTLCRRPARHTAAAPPAPGAGPLKILAAIGAPDEDQTRAVPLDIEAEMGAILDATAQAQGVGAQVRILEAGDPKAIAQALAADDYHILHLSGHGNATSIELSDEDGYAVQVSAGDLADAVRKAGKMMPLVVLSSCHGGGSTEGFAARLLHEGFPRVLAMQAAVRDDYATRFAAELYTALTLDHARTTAAVAAARTQLLDDALLSHGGPRPSGEWATPALLMAAGDAALVDPAAELAPLRRPDAGALAGSVPLLDASGLIGRRGELRTIMRAITSDKRFTNQHGHQGGVIVTGTGGVGKSALVGRVIQRLSTEGWLAAVVSGEWSLNEATLQVVAAAGEASRKAVVQHLAAADDDRARLAAMTALLRSERILLVLDDFERNLHGAALDPLMADQLSRLIDAAGVGKLLVTCRYAVPQLVGLYRVALGPLSPNETRRLLLRLPGLRCLSAGQLQELHRLIGGHPRVLELLDATLLAGTARHPALARKLQRLADDLGIDLDDDRPVDDAVLDAMEMGAADIMLDDLVEQLDPGAGSLLCQVAVSSLPVALDELAEAAGTPSRELRKLAKHLADRSLFTARDPAWVHRWIAARLIARQPADEVREHHRLAARLRLSRIDRLHEVADGIEATRNLLVAGDWDQASTVGTGVVAFLEQHANVQLASFAAEVATALPRDHPDRRFFEDAELRALVALGRTELAVTRYQDMAHAAKQLAEAEPNRTDYQRDLSISYNRLGDLMVAVGDGEQAARYFNDSLTIRRRLAEAEPNRTDYQRDLSVSYNRLGDLMVAVGDGEQAARHFNDSLTIRRRLAEAEPNRTDYQHDLVLSLLRCGQAAAEAQPDLAARLWRDSCDHSAQLIKREPARPDFATANAFSLVLLAEITENPEALLAQARSTLELHGERLPPNGRALLDELRSASETA